MCVVCGEHCVEDTDADKRLKGNVCPVLATVSVRDRDAVRRAAKQQQNKEQEVAWKNL